jgi:hypothetical protein
MQCSIPCRVLNGSVKHGEDHIVRAWLPKKYKNEHGKRYQQQFTCTAHGNCAGAKEKGDAVYRQWAEELRCFHAECWSNVAPDAPPSPPFSRTYTPVPSPPRSPARTSPRDIIPAIALKECSIVEWPLRKPEDASRASDSQEAASKTN